MVLIESQQIPSHRKVTIAPLNADPKPYMEIVRWLDFLKIGGKVIVEDSKPSDATESNLIIKGNETQITAFQSISKAYERFVQEGKEGHVLQTLMNETLRMHEIRLGIKR